jgi:general secretion pathway protein J
VTRAREQAGFTLVEVLVALAIAGMVGLIAMQGIGFATRGVIRLTVRSDELSQRRGLEMQLRRAIGSMAAVPVFDGKPGFTGSADDVSFLSIAEDGAAGLYRLRLAFNAARADRPLILTRQLADGSGPPRASEGILARDLRSFSLAYFGAATPADQPSWQARWRDLAQPPLLLRLTIDDGSGTAQPPIVIRLPNGN